MEGWNGEDENSIPTVNVSLCCYTRFLHGVRGELYPKACLVFIQNSRLLQSSMDIYLVHM